MNKNELAEGEAEADVVDVVDAEEEEEEEKEEEKEEDKQRQQQQLHVDSAPAADPSDLMKREPGKRYMLVGNRVVDADSPEGQKLAASNHHIHGAVGDLARANRQAVRQAHAQVFHPDHEALHAVIFFSLIGIIILSQYVLWYWKTHYTRSFKRVTLLGVWLLPFLMSVYFGFWRMVFCWIAFTLLTVRVFFLSRQRPLAKTTPRRVYTFFLKVYELSYSMAVFGYVLLLVEFLGFSMVLPALRMVTYYSILLIFYGLYFGLLDRDFAEICAEHMSASMGLAGAPDAQKKAKDGGEWLPVRQISPSGDQCAVCGEYFKSANQSLGLDSQQPKNDFDDEKIFKLTCNHRCHESCIRGWCIVGKRDTCAACSEKVRLSEIFNSNPWQKTSVMWAQCLDMLRYLIVWNPVILTVIQVFVFVVDHDPSESAAEAHM